MTWLLGHRPVAENTHPLNVFPADGMKTRLVGKLSTEAEKEDILTLKSVGESRGRWG